MVRVRVSLGSLPREKILYLHKFQRLFLARLQPNPCFAFGFNFSTLIVFPGVNPNPNPRVKLRVRDKISLGSIPE